MLLTTQLNNLYISYILDSLVMETFRMASGVFMVRHNQNDVNFTVTATNETYRIRGGDKVMMYPPAIHKDPEIYENPEVSRGQNNII